MIPVHLLKLIRLHTFSNIADAVTALVTIAIISMDLGLPYNASEEAFYTNPLFQSLAVFCVAYEMIDNLHLSSILLGIWLFIKYSKYFNKPDLKVPNEEKKL